MKQLLALAFSAVFLLANAASFAAESSSPEPQNKNNAMGAPCKTVDGRTCSAGTEGCVCAE
ncbi:hypothetical protein [Legionella sp. km772]|uniref:hypothetical protein n=1 Tax=Legionella sp. km772 TaxID=2498111 RepID=UPI000F8CB7AF|nr:hypothetical protein [Legionella sp. km772]RUR05545.1 hypothetical protein ELY15_14210 [Legionella sp. km772]